MTWTQMSLAERCVLAACTAVQAAIITAALQVLW